MHNKTNTENKEYDNKIDKHTYGNFFNSVKNAVKVVLVAKFNICYGLNERLTLSIDFINLINAQPFKSSLTSFEYPMNLGPLNI